MNYTKIIMAGIGITLLLSSCAASKKAEHTMGSEIYSGTMAYDISIRTQDYPDYCKNGGLVISSVTETLPFQTSDWEWLSNNFPELQRETWQSFIQINLNVIPFPQDFDFECEYGLIDVEQHPRPSDREGCVEINHFSQIGFNTDQNQALVYRVVTCGYSRFETVYFVEHIDGRWTVTDIAETETT